MPDFATEPVQFRCRAAMRRPIDACLDATACGTAKPRQPQRHLSEQRRDRVITIIFHPANPIAAGANRPTDRVLPRLRGGDLALNPREQLFRFRERQSQIGDIAEVIRLADLHDVHARTRVPGYRQLQNPPHAPPPVQEQERKYPARTGTPSFAPVPYQSVRVSIGIAPPGSHITKAAYFSINPRTFAMVVRRALSAAWASPRFSACSTARCSRRACCVRSVASRTR